jgi:hypothetical protein
VSVLVSAKLRLADDRKTPPDSPQHDGWDDE